MPERSFYDNPAVHSRVSTYSHALRTVGKITACKPEFYNVDGALATVFRPIRGTLLDGVK
jgi:hypothetical protein